MDVTWLWTNRPKPENEDSVQILRQWYQIDSIEIEYPQVQSRDEFTLPFSNILLLYNLLYVYRYEEYGNPVMLEDQYPNILQRFRISLALSDGRER